MMRLSTGLSEEEEEDREEAAGLGRMSASSSCWGCGCGCGCCCCCCCCWPAGVDRYGNRRLAGSLNRVAVPGLLSGWFCCIWDGTAVLPDEFRELPGRTGRAFLIDDGPTAPAALRSSSYSGSGVPVSLRTERAEGARPAPELIRLGRSAVAWWFGGSAPGTGDGPLEPLAAAAFSIWALTWEVWRSVR
jgi:hypothetical protein